MGGGRGWEHLDHTTTEGTGEERCIFGGFN